MTFAWMNFNSITVVCHFPADKPKFVLFSSPRGGSLHSIPPDLFSATGWPDVYLALTCMCNGWWISGDGSSDSLNAIGILYYWFDNNW